jgi:hypothetical protein
MDAAMCEKWYGNPPPLALLIRRGKAAFAGQDVVGVVPKTAVLDCLKDLGCGDCFGGFQVRDGSGDPEYAVIGPR